jgi:hypothetical protein
MEALCFSETLISVYLSPHRVRSHKANIDIFAAVRTSILILSRSEDNITSYEYTHSIIIPKFSPELENIYFLLVKRVLCCRNVRSVIQTVVPSAR